MFTMVVLEVEVSLATRRAPCSNHRMSVRQQNFNIGHTFCSVRGRAFIFYMSVFRDKTFLLVPKVLIMWPWPLTYIWKTLTLAITIINCTVRDSWKRRDVTAQLTITIKPDILRILHHDSWETNSVFILDLNATIRKCFTNTTADYQNTIDNRCRKRWTMQNVTNRNLRVPNKFGTWD